VRDWQALVRERLSGRGLTTSQQNEVVAELAAHLEDLYEVARAQGASETDAIRLALEDGTDWRRLSRRIRSSKEQEEQMNNRTRSLWIPGLVSLTAATGTLMLMNRIGIEPRIFWYGSKVGLELYLPWLVILPVFGGLGAYLSRLANGHLRAQLAAALFPAIVYLGFFCLGITVSATIERHLTWRDSPIVALMILNWVLLPGGALFLGALPFLRNSQTHDPAQASC
jgi:hypothetical protein